MRRSALVDRTWREMDGGIRGVERMNERGRRKGMREVRGKSGRRNV